MGIPGYDQWKTASPDDYYPDWVQEADKYLAEIENKQPADPGEARVWAIIEGLREVIKEEVGI